MTEALLRALKRMAHGAGYDVHRLSAAINPAYQLLQSLRHFRVDLVLDVGANRGQFTSDLRDMGYDGRVVSFEPQSRAYEELCRRAGRDPLWSVHPRAAMGDRDAELELNVSANSVSSSLLPMTEAHTGAARESAYVGKEVVPVTTLDSVAPEYMDEQPRAFLKIDVQGYESRVLDGARATLPRLQGILCELSLVPLYEGQPLWLDMIRRIEGEGFTLWSLQRGFTDQRTGRTLQANALFFREVQAA